MTHSVAVAVGAAFAVALVLPAVVLPALRRARIVDVPNERSAHTRPTVRGGGIAPAAGWAAGLAVAASAASSIDELLLWLLLGAGIAGACLGLIEDLRGLPKLHRALGQWGIGLVTGALAAHILGVSSAWAMVGGLACLGGVNVVNFMDGVNGMSALHGMIFGACFIALGTIHDASWMTVAGSVLVAVFMAFFFWNAAGHIFLGDVGSYLLGAIVSMTLLIASMKGLPLLALVAPMAIYLADTSVTLFLRIANGEEWHEAHRDHTYQRLNRRGLSHLAVSGLVAVASVTCASLGLIASSQHGVGRIAAWFGLVLVVIGYSALRARGVPDPADEGMRRRP